MLRPDQPVLALTLPHLASGRVDGEILLLAYWESRKNGGNLEGTNKDDQKTKTKQNKTTPLTMPEKKRKQIEKPWGKSTEGPLM